MPFDRLPLIVELTARNNRRQVARALAESAGAVDLSIFLFDDDIGHYLPVAGFPQTLSDGRRWKSFLNACRNTGYAGDSLPYENVVPMNVIGHRGSDGTIIVFLGGEPEEEKVRELVLLLPLLAAAFRGEQTAAHAKASERVAREMAADAKVLAESLDGARRVLGSALIEAKQAEEALKEADRRKDEFLATLAHELRNPLAPLSNALQMLRISGNNPSVLDSVRPLMERQLRQLVLMVDDLMDVSRISHGKIELRREWISLDDVIASAIEAVQPLIENHRHHLSVHLPRPPARLLADFTRLAQVFSNLLNNAAKYTDPGGQIVVSARVCGHHIEIDVADTGVGIPSEKLRSVFDLFAQVDSSMERSKGGLGIGLTLVKRLVELHGGAIEAKSRGLGTGSIFALRLPIAPGTDSAGAPAENPELNGSPSRRYDILVVDDNNASAQTLMWMLELLGHRVLVAHDGPSGIELATHHVPDVLLLDIGLPGMNGYEVCERMRREPRLSNAVFIAQTGWGQKEHRDRSREAGFDHHLVKPIELNALKAILDNLKATP